MPSFIIGNRSGGDPLIASGNPYSGHPIPLGGIQLTWDRNASGSLYVTLSGNATTQSGGPFLSGGLLDGVQVVPGGSYFVPKLGLPLFSGNPPFPPYFQCDAGASGQGRLYFEVF